MVQLINCPARGLRHRFSSEATVPQHVVEQNQTVLPDSRQHQFIVGVVFGLGRVNGSEVEGQGGFEGLEGRDGGADMQLDAVPDAGFEPIALSYAGPFLAVVEADKPSIRRQTTRDANGTVTGESADLDGRAGANGSNQQAHESPLLFADLHLADFTEAGGVLAQLAQDPAGPVTAPSPAATMQ